MRRVARSKVPQRALALLLAVVMVMGTVFSGNFMTALAEEDRITLTNMSLLQAEVTALPYSSISESGIMSIISRDDNTVAFSTGSNMGTSSWDGEGRYWQIELSTVGYENLELKAGLRSSNTGPADFNLTYSTDGVTFTHLLDDIEVRNSYDDVTTVSLPEEASNSEKLYLRFEKGDDANVKNGAPVAAGGVSNIFNVSITGTEAPAVDPIDAGDVAEGVLTIDEVYELDASTRPTATVIGQIAYVYGKNGSNFVNYILEDVIDGKVIGLQVYDSSNASMGNFAVGDVVTVTGTVSLYKGVVQLAPTEAAKVKTLTPITPQLVTISELLEHPEDYISEYVKIHNVVLGEYVSNGNTAITDGTESTIIYSGAAYPDGAKAGDTAVCYGVFSSYNSNYQFRNGTTDNSYIITKVASTTGGGGSEGGGSEGGGSEGGEGGSEGGGGGSEGGGGITPNPIYDPITDADFADGSKNIKEVYAATVGDTITVIGQLTYQYGNAGTLNTSVIQDVIDGEIVGLQVYNALSSCNIGDVVKVTGTLGEYGSVKQITSPTVEVLRTEQLFAAQELTITELLDGGDNYLSEYVKIKDVTLGTYNGNGNTKLTDSENKTINIYKAAAFPEGVSEGDTVTVYGVFSKYNSTYQLRNGVTGTSYFKPGSYVMDTDLQQTIGKWSGTGALNGATTVYGDLEAENDFLDTSVELSLSTGVSPEYSTTTNNVTSYFIGSTGLTEGQYYQLVIPVEKYGNIGMSFTMRGSNTGAKYFNILYSTDGVNYTKAETICYTINETIYGSDGVGTPTSTTYENKDCLEVKTKNNDYSVTFPAEVNNAEKLYVRVQVQDSTSIKGETIGTGGVNRFFNISVTANPIVDDSICGYVKVSPEEGAIQLGTELTLNSSTTGASIYYSINGGETKLYDEANKPVLNTLPAKVKVYAKKAGIKDSISIIYNYSQVQCATPKFSPNGGAVNLGKEVKITCLTEGVTIYYSMDGGATWTEYTGNFRLNTLPATIQAKAVKNGYLDSEVKTVYFTERESAEYNIYFGQIHSHTEYSDGAGSCEDAFTYASTRAENIDYLIVTDHSNSFDNDTSATIKDGSVSSEWIEAHELADRFDSETFAALYGYEMTWSGGSPGHMNTYNTDGFLSRNMEGFKNGSTSSLPNYYAQLKTVTDSISQFNHPGTTFGDFYDFGFYDEEIDQLITIIEVGNGEGAIGSSGYFPSYEYYTRALDKGWHVAPTNNQDNHKGKWGDANTGRTVVLADVLNDDNIYDAMRNMRVYATEDQDLEIQYYLNDEVMGTIMEETPDNVSIVVKASDPTDASVGKVEVIVNGGLVAASTEISSNSGEVRFNLSPDYSYYYIRITQPDGSIAVTAPVWISEVEALGVSTVSSETDLAIKGEEFDITGSIYNNERTDFLVTSMEFSIKGEVIKTVDLEEAGLTTLGYGETKEYTFNYVYDGLGSTDIILTLKGTLNGVPKVYTGKLTMSFVDPSMVTRVLVDGTHSNDYVNGYYGGNVGNFSALAAAENMQVQVVTTEFTQEMLESCSVLVITAPAKKSGTYNGNPYTVNHFEDEFIALVKDYVDNGGTVILCGLADYQDSADGQSSTEMNRLLDAIGATTRLNSDELMDDTENGGQSYRLYFDDFNMESPYMAGIVDGQTYSSYSGCGILVDAAAKEAGKAEALVYGHTTTYSIDSKSYDSNYIPQQQGSIVALAHEVVGDHEADVFVGGTVFVSNFEVALEMDNASDLPYANRNILLNILAANKKEVEISSIANVRDAELGAMFAIEGYVTAGTASEGNAFFDTIYIQDDTAGITIFPVSDPGIEIGQKIRVLGYVDEYQGDKELQVMSYEILSERRVITPTVVTTAEAADYELTGGLLVKVTGKVTRVEFGANENDVKYIYVMDDSGREAIVFTDGYITSSTGEDNALKYAKVGNTISAIGLVYKNPDGTVIRVRDRAEITLVSAAGEPITPGGGGGNNENPGNAGSQGGGSTTSGGNGNINTGDDTRILPFIIPVAACVVFGGILVYRRKKAVAES